MCLELHARAYHTQRSESPFVTLFVSQTYAGDLWEGREATGRNWAFERNSVCSVWTGAAIIWKSQSLPMTHTAKSGGRSGEGRFPGELPYKVFGIGGE